MYGSVYVLINSAEGEYLTLRIYVSFPQTKISNDKFLIVPFPQCLCQLWPPPTDVQHQHELWRRLSGVQSLLSAEYNCEQKSVLNASTGKVEPLITDTLKSGQPLYNGQIVHPLLIYCPYISTSEEGTTSEQWTKWSSPMCPLFGGSIVYRITF